METTTKHSIPACARPATIHCAICGVETDAGKNRLRKYCPLCEGKDRRPGKYWVAGTPCPHCEQPVHPKDRANRSRYHLRCVAAHQKAYQAAKNAQRRDRRVVTPPVPLTVKQPVTRAAKRPAPPPPVLDTPAERGRVEALLAKARSERVTLPGLRGPGGVLTDDPGGMPYSSRGRS